MLPMDMDDDRYLDDDTGEIRSWWRTPTSDDEHYNPWTSVPPADLRPVASVWQADDQPPAAPELRRTPVRTAVALLAVGVGLTLMALLLHGWITGDDNQPGQPVTQNPGPTSLLPAPLPQASIANKARAELASDDQA